MCKKTKCLKRLPGHEIPSLHQVCQEVCLSRTFVPVQAHSHQAQAHSLAPESTSGVTSSGLREEAVFLKQAGYVMLRNEVNDR